MTVKKIWKSYMCCTHKPVRHSFRVSMFTEENVLHITGLSHHVQSTLYTATSMMSLFMPMLLRIEC